MSDTVKTSFITALVSIVLGVISAYTTIEMKRAEFNAAANQAEATTSELLEKVDSASTAAGQAESATRRLIPTVEAINEALVGLEWKTAGLINGFTNYSRGYADVSYAKDRMGFVHLRGLAKDGNQGEKYPIFILPEGFRPKFHIEVVVGCSGEIPCELIIDQQSGELYFETWDSGWVSLDGVTFSAAP